MLEFFLAKESINYKILLYNASNRM